MRVLSITAQKADSTGSGVFLAELVKAFRKQGHTQAVVCGITAADSLSLPEDVAAFPVYYDTPALPFPVCGMSDEMPYRSTRYRDLDDVMTAQLLDAFREKLREAVTAFAPDVILCHHLYFLAALAKELFPQIPVYGQCHGSDLRQIRKNGWQREWIIPNIRNLDGIFALHEQQKHTITEIFNIPSEKVAVMGTGYNSDVFRLDRSGSDSEKVRLIFAGKLSEKKGVHSLLRSLRLLPNPDRYELALAGGYGNREEYLEICRLAEVCPCPVTFLGKLSHPELAREMNRSHIFVLPSFYEGLPLVLIEAMACGLKTVCTDLPGIRPWLDRTIPGHGTVFVRPPRMYLEDEPDPEDLPAFELALAEAIQSAPHRPLPDPESVRQVSWDGLSEKYCAIWSAAI